MIDGNDPVAEYLDKRKAKSFKRVLTYMVVELESGRFAGSSVGKALGTSLCEEAVRELKIRTAIKIDIYDIRIYFKRHGLYGIETKLANGTVASVLGLHSERDQGRGNGFSALDL